jgi:hypothetical protein
MSQCCEQGFGGLKKGLLAIPDMDLYYEVISEFENLLAKEARKK